MMHCFLLKTPLGAFLVNTMQGMPLGGPRHGNNQAMSLIHRLSLFPNTLSANRPSPQMPVSYGRYLMMSRRATTVQPSAFR